MNGLMDGRGLPRQIIMDNGSEFAAAKIDLWAYTNHVRMGFSLSAVLESPPIKVWDLLKTGGGNRRPACRIGGSDWHSSRCRLSHRSS